MSDTYEKYDIRNLADDEYPACNIGGDKDLDATQAQIASLFCKWKQDHNNMSWREFTHSVVQFDFGAIGVHWCGMWLGIETDGHTHS